ncbi:hypothetical protein N9B65_05920, partial [Akkermansiaceae bacterium]|nr:hypothetical protein [Akkermansiaceae bacterium]
RAGLSRFLDHRLPSISKNVERLRALNVVKPKRCNWLANLSPEKVDRSRLATAWTTGHNDSTPFLVFTLAHDV